MTGAVVPWASGPLRVKVTSWLLLPQVQPVPAADTNVRPAGSVSVTVIVPATSAEPGAPTVSVYVRLFPKVTGSGLSVLVMSASITPGAGVGGSLKTST